MFFWRVKLGILKSMEVLKDYGGAGRSTRLIDMLVFFFFFLDEFLLTFFSSSQIYFLKIPKISHLFTQHLKKTINTYTS